MRSEYSHRHVTPLTVREKPVNSITGSLSPLAFTGIEIGIYTDADGGHLNPKQSNVITKHSHSTNPNYSEFPPFSIPCIVYLFSLPDIIF